jgi:hypothetical protein
MELSGSKNPYAARITVNEKSKEVNLKVTEENIAANNNKVSGEDENPNAGKPDLIALLRQFENLKRAKSPGFVKSEKSVRHYYPVFAANGEVPSGKAEDYPQTTEEKDYPSGKFGYEIYATPSIGFRGTPRGTSANMETEEGNYPDQAKENERRTIPAFNLEAGGSISYALSGIMRFKAGLQLNYSKFNKADADNLQPASAFLMQENDAALSTDMQGTDRRTFINQSYQVSLPLGADLKIADAANIEWFAGASVQPTFNLRSGAALPYQDPGLNENDINNMRSWNINGGIETFISYHAGKRIRLNAGPQLRYQLLSSYRNEFMLNERLYNIGIKLGISSRF